MNVEPRFEWESGSGPDDFKKTLDRLLTTADSVVYRVSQDFALTVEREAKMRAAVDTGHMRASIGHDVQQDRNGIVILVGTEVLYAIYVEKGTKYMDAQPFIEPAFRNNLTQFERRVIEAVFREAGG